MASTDGDDRLWSGGSEVWEEYFEPQRTPLFEAILDICGVVAGMSTLDAGCGSGGVAQRAAQRAARVAGFDISEGMVTLARSKVPEGDFRIGNLVAIPFDDNSFDAVIACDCLPFARDTVAAIAELSRVCKSDGTAVIAIWDEAEHSDHSRVFSSMEAVLSAPLNISPLRLSKRGLLEGLIKKAGRTVEEVRNVPLEYHFKTFEEYWRAARLIAGVKNMIDTAGEDLMRDAAFSGSEPSIQPSGEVVFRNAYRVLVMGAKQKSNQ